VSQSKKGTHQSAADYSVSKGKARDDKPVHLLQSEISTYLFSARELKKIVANRNGPRWKIGFAFLGRTEAVAFPNFPAESAYLESPG
jgi:hypothetical protein